MVSSMSWKPLHSLENPVKVWQAGAYLNNFVQAVMDTFPQDELKGSTIIVSGDGRFYNLEAIQTIIRMAAANGVGRVWVGKDGLMSTPAVSAVLREREGGAAYTGLVLTASHNPGGPEHDFGIKFNTASGSPANEGLTDAVYRRSLELKSYKIAHGTPDVDLSTLGKTMVEGMEVEVIDPVEEYVALLKTVFDFPRLSALLSRPDFSFVFDGMHGVAGAYATRVFVQELGTPKESLLRCEPLEDFGGGHPDPNLAYASDLVRRMGLDGNGRPLPATDDQDEPPTLGAAADGDADRNMIIGKRFFVTPSDSLAVIAANAHAVPYFARAGALGGAARSMPTSGALDRVCEKAGVPMFETPTGWKFFGNLMDAKALGHERSYYPFLCGEESFGTGSDHVREKDGVWAVLAWLSILADRNEGSGTDGKPLIGVQEIVEGHWKEYGRNFYSRYDYEEVDSEGANQMMDHLRAGPAKPGDDLGSGFELKGIDDFEYKDPVDGSVSKKQGIRVMFTDGSRVVFRLSGTGSVGATVRMYIEKYEPNPSKQSLLPADVLQPLVEIGLKLSKLQEFTGRDSPTVIT